MAQQLRAMGFDAYALTDGLAAWRAAYPVEAVPEVPEEVVA